MQSSLHHMQIGNGVVLIEHEDFLVGHQQGYEQYCREYVHKQGTVSTTTLLFLTRNGFAPGVSATWNAGYITGWFTALYECALEEEQGTTDDAEWKRKDEAHLYGAAKQRTTQRKG